MAVDPVLDMVQDMVDAMIAAQICGATATVARKWAIAHFYAPTIADKPYTPRYDPALATPRLSEREWWPLRNWILERDGYECRYCGDTEAPLCADHVVPLSRGGSNDEDNLVCCCLPCNSSKCDKLLSEWRGRYR